MAATRNRRIDYSKVNIGAKPVDPIKQYALEAAISLVHKQEYPHLDDVLEEATKIEKYLKGEED